MLLQRKIKLQSIAPLNIKKRKLNKYLMDQDECDPPGFKEAAPLFEDPAISAIFKRKLCLDEHTMQNLKNPLEPENDEMPPGFMSPEMVERQRQELIENAKRWFPVYLDVQKSKQEKTIEFRSEKLDSRQTMMSRWEQEGISRIHLSQLTTEFPDVEDYYYRTYIKRTKATQGSNSSKKMPIFFPIPTPNQFRSVKAANARDAAIKQKESNGIFSSPERKEEEKKNKRTVEKKDREIAEKEALVKALGKNTASSARKPRRQLQVPFSMVSDFAEEYTAINGKYSLSATIESCFSAVLTLEDLNNLVITLRPKLQDASELDADVAEAQGRLHSLLNSIFFTGFDDESPCKSPQDTSFKQICSLLSLPKALRVLSRAILAYNDDHLTDRVLVRLIGLFEFLDVCRIDVRPELISVFVNNFLAAFVPHVASTNLQSVVRKLSLLVEKGSVLPWVLLNRAGLVLVCVLLSRFQIIKSELPETVDSDSDDTGKYLNEAESSVAKIFSLIQDRLAEIVSGDCGGDDAGFYGWQFVALLAMSIEAEKKRILVAELRERILSVVQSGNPEAIANLDIFLHVIGLNSSQLAS